MKLTADLIWRQMLELGKDWNNSVIARRLQVTPEAVRLQIKKNGLKAKWDAFQKLNANEEPAVQAVLSRVASRLKLEELDNSVLALEVYNEAIIGVAGKIIKDVDCVTIKTVSDLERLVTVVAFALKANAEARGHLVEVMAEAQKVCPHTCDQTATDGRSAKVLSLAEKVEKKRKPTIEDE